MKYENFYIKAPVGMLGIPLPLVAFEKPIDNTDVERHYTIPEYLAVSGHTVKRFSNDGVFFLKGFGFNIAGLDEMRVKLGDYGMIENTNFFILSHPEAIEELATANWTIDTI